MTTAGSVSKGCFAFKGKKKNARIEDYLPSSKEDSSARVRHDGFSRMWEDIDTQIQILQSDLNTKIFEDLLQFASGSHVGFTTGSVRGIVQEIPTAALVTGVNTPDHSIMFGNLVTMLQERVTPLVAILKAKDCQNVKGILGRTLSQLLDNPDIAEDNEEEESVRSKNLPLTLSTLATWYRNKYMTGKSSPKKRKLTNGKAVPNWERPPVVVVFEDLESFVPRVVQDFITIASNYINQLPLVFVFGIATSVSAVHRLLPNEVSSLLCMEKFQAPPSTEYLSLVINQILMTPKFPFKLGGKVFQLLLDIFLYHDFSVLNFNKGLRFAMLDHYFNMPVSYLCCPLEDVAAVLKRMNHDNVEKVRMLSSFRSYVEGCDVSLQPNMLLDDNITKNEIFKLLTDLHSYHESFFPVLRCLHTLVTKLPKQPLGKQLREVYSYSLESNIFEEEAYTHSLELLKIMSKDELQELIKQSTVHFCTSSLEPLKDVTSKLQEYLHRFDTLNDAVDDEDNDNNVEMPDTSLPTRTSLHQLRQQLQDISKRKKKQTPYEKLRNEVIDYFDAVFRKYLQCPKTLPLHEILYYNSASTVKRYLNSAPRSALQTALSNPHHYLQCQCCKSDSGQVQSTMPDVCIVYKLHLECGQLINLYDWMQAFMTVVQAEDEENEEKHGKPDKFLQARFIRAVSELQFLGFIKPTKRKTDHVARLTWGGC